MARKTIVELIDDFDGSKADTTVEFGLDGVSYEIDLSEENAAKLRADLSEWITKARRVGGRRNRGTSTSTVTSNDTAKIREWARERNIEVSDRGRIAAEVRQAYYDANGN